MREDSGDLPAFSRAADHMPRAIACVQGYSLRVTRWWPLLVLKWLCGPVRPEVEERLVCAPFSEQCRLGFSVFLAGGRKRILRILVSRETVTSQIMGTRPSPVPDT